MSEHLLIAAIDERLIAIGLSDAALEIVRVMCPAALCGHRPVNIKETSRSALQSFT